MNQLQTAKKCKNCGNIFIDRSHAQSAKCCCKRCQNSYYYSCHCDKLKARVRQYKSKPERKIKEKFINQQYYLQHKDEQRIKSNKWTKANRAAKNAIQAKRRATIFKATPNWLTSKQLYDIKSYYVVAKLLAILLNEPIHVDHIIPLRGKNVCGLHVPWNLQLMRAKDNLIKYNN